MKLLRPCLVALACGATATVGAPPNASELRLVKANDGALTIVAGSQTLAEFSTGDEQTPRPFFANVRTLAGTSVTRPRPLVEGEGADAYVPPLTSELQGGLSGSTGNEYGASFSPAGGPCERAYRRAITSSHPTWWDRYEHCMRLEQAR